MHLKNTSEHVGISAIRPPPTLPQTGRLQIVCFYQVFAGTLILPSRFILNIRPESYRRSTAVGNTVFSFYMGVNRQTKEGLSFSIILGPPFLKIKIGDFKFGLLINLAFNLDAIVPLPVTGRYADPLLKRSLHE